MSSPTKNKKNEKNYVFLPQHLEEIELPKFDEKNENLKRCAFEFAFFFGTWALKSSSTISKISEIPFRIRNRQLSSNQNQKSKIFLFLKAQNGIFLMIISSLQGVLIKIAKQKQQISFGQMAFAGYFVQIIICGMIILVQKNSKKTTTSRKLWILIVGSFDSETVFLIFTPKDTTWQIFFLCFEGKFCCVWSFKIGKKRHVITICFSKILLSLLEKF